MGRYTRNNFGEPSYYIKTSRVKVDVSIKGGMCTASFLHGNTGIFPYFVSPWWNEAPNLSLDPVLQAMRGDYFCFPFGANGKPLDSIEYPIHGRTANECWDFKSLDEDDDTKTLRLTLELLPEQGEVEKCITLTEKAPLVYTNHIVRNYSGSTSFANHPIIQCSREPGSAFIDMSEPVGAFTPPFPLGTPENKGYSLLKADIEITDSTRVPTVYGDTVDVTKYPLPLGYEDAVQYLSNQEKPFVYTAITDTKKGFLYFHLKNPKILTSTLLWMPNYGNYGEPFRGRVGAVIGLEEITGYFFYGRKESVESNPLSQAGFTTSKQFAPGKDIEIKLISGAVPVSDTFKGVKDVVSKNSSEISILGKGGERIDLPCSLDFIL